MTNYGYDAESQLTSVSNSETNTSESFSYDSLGNRLNDHLGTYSYDQKSQRLTEDYRYIYLYDNNGNMTSRQEKGMTGNLTNYSYSSQNQLMKIEKFENNVKVKTVNYIYDALGRRIQKEIIDHQDALKSFSRKYAYDGQEILAEFDADNATLAVYTHSTMRTDDVLAADIRSNKMANQSGSYLYLKGALGSIVDVTDSSGNLIQHYAYSSFGKLLSIKDTSGNDVSASPAVRTSYGFTNREYDEESGMMYYRARYYMPEIGRFIQEDPHPGTKKMPSTINSKYIYTGNNPVLYTDPTGKFITLAAIGMAALIGGSVAVAVDVYNHNGSFDLGRAAGAFAAGAVGGAISAIGIAAGGAYFGGIIGKMFGGAIANGLIAAHSGGNVGAAMLAGGLGVLVGDLIFGSLSPGSAGNPSDPYGTVDLNFENGGHKPVINPVDLIDPNPTTGPTINNVPF